MKKVEDLFRDARLEGPFKHIDNGFDGYIVDSQGRHVCGGERCEGYIPLGVGMLLVAGLNMLWENQKMTVEEDERVIPTTWRNESHRCTKVR